MHTGSLHHGGATGVTEAWEGPLTRSCWRTGSSQRGTPSTAVRGGRLRTSHQQTRSCTPKHPLHPMDTSWLSCSYGGQHGQRIASHVEEAVCAVVHPHRQECCTYAGPGYTGSRPIPALQVPLACARQLTLVHVGRGVVGAPEAGLHLQRSAAGALRTCRRWGTVQAGFCGVPGWLFGSTFAGPHQGGAVQRPPPLSLS